MGDRPEWIKHDGKGYPENLVGRVISKRYRDGQESRGELVADLCSDIVWRWDEKHSSHDIIEYKVIS